jgi:stress-induced morphogen
MATAIRQHSKENPKGSQVKRTLIEILQDYGTVSLSTSATDMVSGLIVSSKFRGKDQVDRQKAIWSKIRHKLSQAEANKISAIITLTPKELD